MSAVQMTDKQFKELLEAIRTLAPDTEKEKKEAAAKRSLSSFSKCSAKFSGKCDEIEVDKFISAVDVYKQTEEISDEDALKGISLLFFGNASIWWKGVKRNIKTWDEALKAIRENFSPVKPIYQIYQEIFESKQKEYELLDSFLMQKRALLVKLPEGLHDEETQINFIYGLLHEKYRKHIPRHEVQTFQQLLEKGRQLEKTES